MINTSNTEKVSNIQLPPLCNFCFSNYDSSRCIMFQIRENRNYQHRKSHKAAAVAADAYQTLMMHHFPLDLQLSKNDMFYKDHLLKFPFIMATPKNLPGFLQAQNILPPPQQRNQDLHSSRKTGTEKKYL